MHVNANPVFYRGMDLVDADSALMDMLFTVPQKMLHLSTLALMRAQKAMLAEMSMADKVNLVCMEMDIYIFVKLILTIYISSYKNNCLHLYGHACKFKVQ